MIEREFIGRVFDIAHNGHHYCASVGTRGGVIQIHSFDVNLEPKMLWYNGDGDTAPLEFHNWRGRTIATCWHSKLYVQVHCQVAKQINCPKGFRTYLDKYNQAYIDGRNHPDCRLARSENYDIFMSCNDWQREQAAREKLEEESPRLAEVVRATPNYCPILFDRRNHTIKVFDLKYGYLSHAAIAPDEQTFAISIGDGTVAIMDIDEH